jgi:mRNA interferase RelE/StbE
LVWNIEVSDEAKRQLARLGRTEAARITRFLRERVSVLDNPRTIGGPQEGARFHGLWRYRVGDYRVLVDIRDGLLVIVLVGVGHRSAVYR